MQFRTFGNSTLKVSEVGFGAWTLAMKWWGEVADPPSLVHAALDSGITFFDTAPVYGEEGAGETLLADVLAKLPASQREELVITTKCGYDIAAPRIAPGHSERPHDWRPESIRSQLEESLRRLQLDHIDLYQAHNTTIDPIRNDDLWAELENQQAAGKIRELGVALGPAIGWTVEGQTAMRDRSIRSLQTVFNILEQEPGRTFLADDAVRSGKVGVIARVPHASDVLSGLVTRDTVFAAEDHRSHRNRDNLLDLFDKSERVAFLSQPEADRTIGQSAIAGILAFDGITTVLPTCTTAEQVREYAAASDMPLTADEKSRLHAEAENNFGVVDRYNEPLKSSV